MSRFDLGKYIKFPNMNCHGRHPELYSTNSQAERIVSGFPFGLTICNQQLALPSSKVVAII